MKTSRFTDSQIIAILKQAEAGTPVPDLCREHGMSSASFYKWRSKYGGMDAALMTRMKELEAENARLKKMYAEERLKADVLKEAIEKNVWSAPVLQASTGERSSLRKCIRPLASQPLLAARP
jgi:putative transposase